MYDFAIEAKLLKAGGMRRIYEYKNQIWRPLLCSRDFDLNFEGTVLEGFAQIDQTFQNVLDLYTEK